MPPSAGGKLNAIPREDQDIELPAPTVVVSHAREDPSVPLFDRNDALAVTDGARLAGRAKTPPGLAIGGDQLLASKAEHAAPPTRSSRTWDTTWIRVAVSGP